MSSPVKKIQKIKSLDRPGTTQYGRDAGKRNLMATARELGKAAADLHEEGVQYATDFLNECIREGDKNCRKTLSVAYRTVSTEAGEGTIVSLLERADGDIPRHVLEILVATMKDEFACTDSAMATSVGFTSKAMTIIEEDDGSRFGTELWSKTISKTVE